MSILRVMVNFPKEKVWRLATVSGIQCDPDIDPLYNLSWNGGNRNLIPTKDLRNRQMYILLDVLPGVNDEADLIKDQSPNVGQGVSGIGQEGK